MTYNEDNMNFMIDIEAYLDTNNMSDVWHISIPNIRPLPDMGAIGVPVWMTVSRQIVSIIVWLACAFRHHTFYSFSVGKHAASGYPSLSGGMQIRQLTIQFILQYSRRGSKSSLKSRGKRATHALFSTNVSCTLNTILTNRNYSMKTIYCSQFY